MNKDAAISVRIPSEIEEQINSIAHLRGRTKSWIINEALRGYVESERQFLEAVAEGLRDVDEGRIVPHETVMQELSDIIAAARARQTSRQ